MPREISFNCVYLTPQNACMRIFLTRQFAFEILFRKCKNLKLDQKMFLQCFLRKPTGTNETLPCACLSNNFASHLNDFRLKVK